jgi:hypothetical protein
LEKKYGTQATNAATNLPNSSTQDRAAAQKEYELYWQELRERELKRQ